jgi:hypothetical protein
MRTTTITDPFTARLALGEPKGWTGNGHYGAWRVDEYGLPCHDFVAPAPESAFTPETTEPDVSPSPWHQIGNQRFTATFHEDGYLQLYSSDRGPCRITPHQPRLGPFGGGVASVELEEGRSLSMRKSLLPDAVDRLTRFGLGYGQLALSIGNARVNLDHWAPDGALPALLTDIEITPDTDRPLPRALHLHHGVGYWFIAFDPLCTGWNRSRFGEAPMDRSMRGEVGFAQAYTGTILPAAYRSTVNLARGVANGQ